MVCIRLILVLLQPTVGVTRMDDLSAKDRGKIRSLALIELTAMLDEQNITYTRRKRKKKVKGETLIMLRNL